MGLASRFGLSMLRRNAIYRGFLGGSRGWQVLGIVYFGGKFVKKALGREPEDVATEDLTPGQAIQIRAIDPKTLRRKR